MRDLLATLVNRDHPVDQGMWRSFWERVSNGQLRRGEAVAVLTSLSIRPPDPVTLHAFVSSLSERTPRQPTMRFPDTVNIVGTGGGPKTFNVSTASAFVAAALGVRVVKTGSRGYSSRYGSVDLLQHLGIRLAKSYEQIDELLTRFGIAFAGHFVYPDELSLLAKSALPFDMRMVGRFVNSVGPFLAEIELSGQLTGVSDHSLLTGLRGLASDRTDTRIWICTNPCGADELISFCDNVIYPNDGEPEIKLSPGALGLDAGTMEDLSPVRDEAPVVDHLLAQLAGDGSRAALQTIWLNAAALTVLSNVTDDWSTALRAAKEVIERGAVTDLIYQMRKHVTRVPVNVSKGVPTRA